jgi:hypothetical protein
MFTAEKSKLFFNDPKFLSIGEWSADGQEAAVGKIFAGQRQVRRSKVAYHALRPSDPPASPYLLLDCLQTRMAAFEARLVRNVEEYPSPHAAPSWRRNASRRSTARRKTFTRSPSAS